MIIHHILDHKIECLIVLRERNVKSGCIRIIQVESRLILEVKDSTFTLIQAVYVA